MVPDRRCGWLPPLVAMYLQAAFMFPIRWQLDLEPWLYSGSIFFFFLGKTTSQIIPCFLLASVMRLTRPVWPNARNAETARAPVAPAWCRPYWIIVSTIDKCSLDWLFPSGWWDDDFEDPSCVYESFSALHGGCWLETRTTSGHVSSLRAAWIYMTICWQIFFKRLWIFGSLLG